MVSENVKNIFNLIRFKIVIQQNKKKISEKYFFLNF